MVATRSSNLWAETKVAEESGCADASVGKSVSSQQHVCTAMEKEGPQDA